MCSHGPKQEVGVFPPDSDAFRVLPNALHIPAFLQAAPFQNKVVLIAPTATITEYLTLSGFGVIGKPPLQFIT